MASLSQLKKKKGNNLKKLQEKLEQQQGGYQRDERIWKPKFNKEKGKGTCIIRFLPAQEGEPFVEVMSYSFSDRGGNFWGNALQTIGEKDPVQIAAINAFKKAKNEGDLALKERAKKFLPRSQYYANVLVIKDEEVPENEGKVMIFQFGRQIFEKIKNAIQPEFDDQDPMDPFDLDEGADFRIRMVGKEIPDSKTGNKVLVPNYENSTFDRPEALFEGDEEKQEEVYAKTYDLSEFIAPEKFKSFDEVASQFKKVTGKSYDWLSPEGAAEAVEEEKQERKLEEDQDNDDGSNKHRSEPNFSDDGDSFEPPKSEDKAEDQEDDDDDDPVARFRRIANQS